MKVLKKLLSINQLLATTVSNHLRLVFWTQMGPPAHDQPPGRGGRRPGIPSSCRNCDFKTLCRVFIYYLRHHLPSPCPLFRDYTPCLKRVRGGGGGKESPIGGTLPPLQQSQHLSLSPLSVYTQRIFLM